MRYISRLLFLLTAVFTAAAVDPAEKWQWNYYFERNIPAGLVGGKTLDGTLTLPDKKVVRAKKIDYPASCTIDLAKVVEPAPETLDRVIITADFYCDKAERVVLGGGIDWFAKIYANNKLIFDSTVPGNGEMPISYTNHMAEFVSKPGRNQLIFDVRCGRDSKLFSVKELDVPPLAVKYQPWSMFPDSFDNAVSIVFSTTRMSPAAVDYRIKGSEKWTRVYDNQAGIMRRDEAVHCIRIEDLQPDTEYEYRAVLVDEAKSFKEIPQNEIYTFKSAPAYAYAKDFSFAVTSDLQMPDDEREKLLKKIFTFPGFENSSFFAFLGDVLWTSNFDLMIIDNFVNFFRAGCNNRMQLVMVRGNHEIYGRDSNRYFKYFKSPRTVEQSYFMFTYGEVCFIVLDFLDDSSRQPAPSTRAQFDFEPFFKAQAKWLKSAVESAEFKQAKYRIVLCHTAPLGNLGRYLPGNVRSCIEPLFTGDNPKYRIHLWLAGHTHRAFRSIVRQNAARSVLDVNFNPKAKHPAIGEKYPFPVIVMGGRNWRVDKSFQQTALQVAVKSGILEVRHYDNTGKLFDHIKITPDGKVTEVYADEVRFKKYNY